MTSYQGVFKRYEKKYMLTQPQYAGLLHAFEGKLAQDQYGLHTVSNIYLDTDDYALIRASIEKPVYKEKIRLRSYGIPRPEDSVFLELKKKYEGIVYKRRITLKHDEAAAYLFKGESPRVKSQILKEIEYFMGQYQPVPKVLIAYDRTAYAGLADPSIRVTFDENIRFRTTTLDLSKGCWGTSLLPADAVLMEIKVADSMPLWLSQALSGLDIMQTSFSKYGQCYTLHLIADFTYAGGMAHVS